MTASGPSFSSKGKGRAEPDVKETTEEERLAKEARQRSFERSLAGPSVGKAGERRRRGSWLCSVPAMLIRCRTSERPDWYVNRHFHIGRTDFGRDQQGHRRSLQGGSCSGKSGMKLLIGIRGPSKTDGSDTVSVRSSCRFYTNQVRKDEVLTKKIAWFQAKVRRAVPDRAIDAILTLQRDSLMKDAQLDRLKAEADRIVSLNPPTPLTYQLMEVEATRDMSQSIVHVDMDAFVGHRDAQLTID